MSAAAVAILVEDEPQIRRFVRTALESENWRVLEAGTLKRGLSETAAGGRTWSCSIGRCRTATVSVMGRHQPRVPRTPVSVWAESSPSTVGSSRRNGQPLLGSAVDRLNERDAHSLRHVLRSCVDANAPAAVHDVARCCAVSTSRRSSGEPVPRAGFGFGVARTVRTKAPLAGHASVLRFRRCANIVEVRPDRSQSMPRSSAGKSRIDGTVLLASVHRHPAIRQWHTRDRDHCGWPGLTRAPLRRQLLG
jgi:hypothetical protein